MTEAGELRLGDIYGLNDHLQRAKDYIQGGDDHSLIHAALELRFCMEAVAYRQLQMYQEKVPTEIARHWKPNVIVKMLALFDEASDQTAEISISIDAPKDISAAVAAGDVEPLKQLNYLMLGNTYRIPWRRFEKMYHSLGSYLHLDKGACNVYPTREKLNQVVVDLEQVSRSTIITAVSDVVTVECDCKAVLVLGPKHRSGQASIDCPNRKCNALYQMDAENPNVLRSLPGIRLNCPCGALVKIYRERVLSKETCPSCNATVQPVVLQLLKRVSGPPESVAEE